ncbi:hypothetical protein niasHS_015546 [Heterodera schachtii]|uniref:Uncharacterized protein n=1 Tax=Heterodera schachtii TaxID=97005 RepID=A0ABD2IK96_HETSC
MCEDMLAVTECMTKTGMSENDCKNSQKNDPNFAKFYGGYTCDKCIFGEQYKANSNEHFKLYSPTAKPLTPITTTNELGNKAEIKEIFVPINVDNSRSGYACIMLKSHFTVVIFAVLAIIGARIHDKMFE